MKNWLSVLLVAATPLAGLTLAPASAEARDRGERRYAKRYYRGDAYRPYVRHRYGRPRYRYYGVRHHYYRPRHYYVGYPYGYYPYGYYYGPRPYFYSGPSVSFSFGF